ncbi:hypothetical protein [Flavobacterium sp.]|jgi:hypothetical protein|nr:hypothetical protein [Flavobacterium sp.]
MHNKSQKNYACILIIVEFVKNHVKWKEALRYVLFNALQCW